MLVEGGHRRPGGLRTLTTGMERRLELDGGYMPSMIWEIPAEVSVSPGVTNFANAALENLAAAHDSIIESRVFQTHWANTHCRQDPEIKINDLVYVSTKNLALPKGRASKLLPKFVGPYPVMGIIDGSSIYELGLPTELQKRGIFNKFHVSLLRPHYPNNDVLFPSRTLVEPYDFGEPIECEWLIDDIIGHQWEGRKILFHVLWNLGNITIEPYQTCKDLEALDRYLALKGVSNWRLLPRKH